MCGRRRIGILGLLGKPCGSAGGVVGGGCAGCGAFDRQTTDEASTFFGAGDGMPVGGGLRRGVSGAFWGSNTGRSVLIARSTGGS